MATAETPSEIALAVTETGRATAEATALHATEADGIQLFSRVIVTHSPTEQGLVRFRGAKRWSKRSDCERSKLTRTYISRRSV